MASYAFIQPVKAGKTAAWKQLIAEMQGPRKKEHKESRKKAGLKREQVWLQSTPMGDFAVVVFEASDAKKVFQHFMTSTNAYDKWFAENVLVGIHGMNPSAPPPPMNELIFDYKG
ncbi:MAG: hypothetical protein FJ039_03235 [Chloroflexi bacterium]|nr:hypothetical protein [Chloroflexota bacterium]